MGAGAGTPWTLLVGPLDAQTRAKLCRALSKVPCGSGHRPRSEHPPPPPSAFGAHDGRCARSRAAPFPRARRRGPIGPTPCVGTPPPLRLGAHVPPAASAKYHAGYAAFQWVAAFLFRVRGRDTGAARRQARCSAHVLQVLCDVPSAVTAAAVCTGRPGRVGPFRRRRAGGRRRPPAREIRDLPPPEQPAAAHSRCSRHRAVSGLARAPWRRRNARAAVATPPCGPIFCPGCPRWVCGPASSGGAVGSTAARRALPCTRSAAHTARTTRLARWTPLYAPVRGPGAGKGGKAAVGRPSRRGAGGRRERPFAGLPGLRRAGAPREGAAHAGRAACGQRRAAGDGTAALGERQAPFLRVRVQGCCLLLQARQTGPRAHDL